MDLSFLRWTTPLSLYNEPNQLSSSTTYEQSFSTLFETMLKDAAMEKSNKTAVSAKANLFLDPRLYYKWESLKQATVQNAQIKPTVTARNEGIETATKNKVPYQNIIEEAARTYNLDPNLIAAVIKHESNFNPQAKSHAGAIGLMQLMPQTARMLGVHNAYDPKQNIYGGAKYLRQMLDRYNGDVKLALAAYNAGPGNVDRYGGIPPFKETKQYVPRVYNEYRQNATYV